MGSAIPSTSALDEKISPWNVEIVTRSNSLIAQFEKFDKTKSNAPKLRSSNRAIKWRISNLLKREFKVPVGHKLQNVDLMMAFQDVIDSLAILGGVTYKEYLLSC